MTEGRAGLRLKVLVVLVITMFAALTTRLWYLQVLAVEKARDGAHSNAVRLVEIPAQRGSIYDASGEQLVGSERSLIITINRQEVGDRREDVLYKLSQLLDVSAAELGQRLDDDRFYPFTPIPVAANVPERVVAYIKELGRDEFPGVQVVEQPIRTYPLGSAAAHLLGYLGQISPEKLTDPAFAGYEAGDLVGVSGVESVYEHDLAGIAGIVKYRVNSLGENLGEFGLQDPAPGNDVYLTIDADTQRLAEESLRAGIRTAHETFDTSSSKYLQANAGAVIVMNPDTGGLEAMVSYPGFQPTAFIRGMSNTEFERRFGEAKGYPLLNRAIAGQYPPGSTYKPWIALSALGTRREGAEQDDDIVELGRSYGCPPVWTAPFDENNPDAIQYDFRNWTTANLGFMNLSQALGTGGVACVACGVRASAAIERVHAGAADQGVVAAVSEQLVIAGAAVGVVAVHASAKACVVAEQAVIAATALDVIVAAVADERVGDTVTLDDVVADGAADILDRNQDVAFGETAGLGGALEVDVDGSYKSYPWIEL